MKKIISIMIVVVMAMIVTACDSEPNAIKEANFEISSNILQTQSGDKTLFEYSGLQYSVPGTDWIQDDIEGTDPVIIDYRSESIGGFNVIAFSKPESNYCFFEQSYNNNQKVETQFAKGVDTKGVSSDVLRKQIQNHTVYIANTAVEEKDESGFATYDFVVSTMLDENSYCDIFFFIKAENAEEYNVIKDEIISSIKSNE